MRYRSLQLIVSLSLVVVALIVGCAPVEPRSEHPAAAAIDELLQLRRNDVRDPAAYEVFFEDATLASAIAEGSDEPTGTPQVPPYRTPYLSAESTSTAEVAVVWELDEAFPEWVPVTVFYTRLADGQWRVTDAIEATVAPEPLLPEAD